jgi:site-specific DNA-methyltransferase (adenine-specific)
LTPFFEHEYATLYHGKCEVVLPLLPESFSDSIVTDPPYELSFMGKGWDGTGIAYNVEMWAAALRVLKPGGHLLAFGGPRTSHRMVCAIEDAGFEIRDTIMWIFGSGFPKSLDVSKAIDKAAGAERVLTRPGTRQRDGYGEDWDTNSSSERPRYDIPATETAAAWKGWGTALKPAFEPIVIARKPFRSSVAENVLKHGTGALNIDRCRIPTEDALTGSGSPPLKFGGQNHRPFHDRDGEASAQRRYDKNGGTNFAATPGPRGGDPLGRWPANVIHDGSDEVVELFPDDAGAAAPVFRRNGDKFRTAYGAFAGNLDEQGSTFQGDQGSAARFFYCAKADRQDRNEGCDELPERPLNWSSGDQAPGTFRETDRANALPLPAGHTAGRSGARSFYGLGLDLQSRARRGLPLRRHRAGAALL